MFELFWKLHENKAKLLETAPRGLRARSVLQIVYILLALRIMPSQQWYLKSLMIVLRSIFFCSLARPESLTGPGRIRYRRLELIYPLHSSNAYLIFVVPSSTLGIGIPHCVFEGKPYSPVVTATSRATIEGTRANIFCRHADIPRHRILGGRRGATTLPLECLPWRGRSSRAVLLAMEARAAGCRTHRDSLQQPLRSIPSA